MNQKLFNKRYGEKGGINQLFKMKSQLCTLKEIGGHFGVGRERVRQWMLELIKDKYDPRIARRKKRIEEIKNMLKNTPSEDVQKLKMVNTYYFKEAMKEINNKK